MCYTVERLAVTEFKCAVPYSFAHTSIMLIELYIIIQQLILLQCGVSNVLIMENYVAVFVHSLPPVKVVTKMPFFCI